jgi:hypothetical protein
MNESFLELSSHLDSLSIADKFEHDHDHDLDVEDDDVVVQSNN